MSRALWVSLLSVFTGLNSYANRGVVIDLFPTAAPTARECQGYQAEFQQVHGDFQSFHRNRADYVKSVIEDLSKCWQHFPETFSPDEQALESVQAWAQLADLQNLADKSLRRACRNITEGNVADDVERAFRFKPENVSKDTFWYGMAVCGEPVNGKTINNAKDTLLKKGYAAGAERCAEELRRASEEPEENRQRQSVILSCLQEDERFEIDKLYRKESLSLSVGDEVDTVRQFDPALYKTATEEIFNDRLQRLAKLMDLSGQPRAKFRTKNNGVLFKLLKRLESQGVALRR